MASQVNPPAPRKAVRKSSRGPARKTPRQSAATSEPGIGGSPDLGSIVNVARQLRGWTDSVLGIAGAAADVSLGAAKALLVRPEQRATLERTGHVLKGMREAAGLSLREVGEAINLKDPALLDLVENGKVALPFEVILRLASVLGRNDPISFVMRFTRSYNPETWRTLENLGIGRFAVQAGREREFANIYRGSDLARRLDDDEFAAVLTFVKAAFDLAMAFRVPVHAPKAKSRKA